MTFEKRCWRLLHSPAVLVTTLDQTVQRPDLSLRHGRISGAMSSFSLQEGPATLDPVRCRIGDVSNEASHCSSASTEPLAARTTELGIRKSDRRHQAFCPCLRRTKLCVVNGLSCVARDTQLLVRTLPSLSFPTKALESRSAGLSCLVDRSRTDLDKSNAQIRTRA